MNRNQLYFFLSSFAFTFLSVTIVLCRVSFQISQLNECPPHASKFLTLVDRSLEQCVEECSLRGVCDVVGYKRSLRLCELHINSSSPSVADNHCVLIYRKGMDRPPPKCNCAEWKVCDTSASNGHCSTQECEPPSPPENGKYSGNKNTVGSTKAVMCNHGNIEMNKTKSIKCMKNGKWSNTVSCVRIDCGAVPILKNGTIIQDLPKNSTYGSLASVRCKDEYETEMSKIICPITGSWPVPVCRPNECPSGEKWLHLTDTFEVQFHQAAKTQSEAEKLCKETIGGRLVILDELWKMDNITTVLKICNGYQNYWTDGKKMEDSQEWRFSGGTLMPDFWGPGQPDFNKTYCVTVTSKGWNDRRCDNSFRCICEKY